MFNESDYIYVMDKAQRCGLTISEYCHQAAMDGAVKEHIQPEQAALIRDIAGVANNVNQIAKRANEVGVIDEMDIRGVSKRQERMLEQMARLLEKLSGLN